MLLSLLIVGITVGGGFSMPVPTEPCTLEINDTNSYCIVTLETQTCSLHFDEIQCNELRLTAGNVTCTWGFMEENTFLPLTSASYVDATTLHIRFSELESIKCTGVTIVCRDDDQLDLILHEIVLKRSGRQILSFSTHCRV